MAVITELSFQKKDGSRVNLYLDGVFYCGLPAITAAEHRLKKDMEIDEKRLKEIIAVADSEQALVKATALVARVLKTKKELIEWLKQKNFGEIAVSETVAKLEEYGYIDDAAYAKAYINSHINSSGKKKLEYELKGRGVSAFILEDVFTEGNYDFNFYAQKTAEKYVKNKILDAGLIKKLLGHLYSRGYSSGETEFALKALKAETEIDE